MAETFEQLKAIPWAALWSLALATGGLFLVSYFASIKHLPDLKIEDLTGTILAVAVVGMFVVIFIGYGLILPILFLKPGRSFGYVLSKAAMGTATAIAIFLNLALDLPCKGLVWAAIPMVSIAACIWHAHYFSKQSWFSETAITVFHVGSWALWALMVPMLYYGSIASQNEDSDLTTWLMLFLAPALFAVVSVILSSLPDSQRKGFQLAAAVGSVVLLSVIANSPAFIPQTVIALLGLSVDRKPVTLVLTESGCNAANLLLDGKPCTFDSGTKLGSLLDVRIVSRVGAQVVVHWQHGMNLTATVCAATNNNWRRTILKKDDVVSWAYDYGKHVKDVQSQGK